MARELDQIKPGEFLNRVGGHHVIRGNWTPPALSDLVPGGGKLPGVSLVWQATASSFQGYYQGAEPRASTSARYGGPRTPISATTALEQSRELTCEPIVVIDGRRPGPGPALGLQTVTLGSGCSSVRSV